MPENPETFPTDSSHVSPVLQGCCPDFSDAEIESIFDGQSEDQRASQLSEHLETCDICQQKFHYLLQKSASNPLISFKASQAEFSLRILPPYPVRLDYLPGEYIGNFEVIRVIGKGGTSVVYECMDHRLVRRVAVKTLTHKAFDNTNLARLEREARLLAKLDHPGVVRAYEIHTLEEPPFIVMEMVNGGSSRELLKNGPLPHRLAARLISDVAEAVHHAHLHDILHRDIKTSNLLVVEYPPGSRLDPIGQIAIKVSDFGLARPILESSDLTSTNAVMGTPAYMSPEQTFGSELNIGTSSDIYSLGVVLYEFLIGRPPLIAENGLRTMQMIQEVEPLPLRSILHEIPVDLETICLKCLRKKPEDRYTTASDLAGDLQRFLDGKPILARPVGNFEKVFRWVRRNRPLAAALACSVMLAAGLLVTSIRFALVQQSLNKVANEIAATATYNASQAKAQSTLDQANAKRFESVANQLLVETDQTRNFLFMGIKNLEVITGQLNKVDNNADAIRLSEKAKSMNAALIDNYLARSSVASKNLDTSQMETLLRDGRNLMLIGFKDKGLQLLQQLFQMIIKAKSNSNEYLQLRKLGLVTALVIAQGLTDAAQPQEAIKVMILAWNELGFSDLAPGINLEHRFYRKMVLNQLLELVQKYPSPEIRLTPADLEQIQAEIDRLDLAMR